MNSIIQTCDKKSDRKINAIPTKMNLYPSKFHQVYIFSLNQILKISRGAHT